MTAPRALLHIGDRKTGSTTLQRFFTANADALAERGVRLATTGRHIDRHTGLTAYALDDALMAHGARKQWRIETTDALTRFRADLTAELREEAAATPADATLLFTHEDLFQISVSAVHRLAALLQETFSEIRVVVYLRRQIDRDVSEYGQSVKNDTTDRDILARRPSDYWTMLTPWSAAFGDDALRVRLFDRAAFEGGDLLDDFAEAGGLPALDGLERVAPSNESLSVAAQDFMRALNVAWPKAKGPPRAFITRAVLEAFGGTGRQPSRADAARLMRRYRQSNERVRAKWFPDRATLFDEDLSRFPEREAPESPASELVRIAVELVQRALATSDTTASRLRALQDKHRAQGERLKAQAARNAELAETNRRLRAALRDRRALASDERSSVAPDAPSE